MSVTRSLARYTSAVNLYVVAAFIVVIALISMFWNPFREQPLQVTYGADGQQVIVNQGASAENQNTGSPESQTKSLAEARPAEAEADSHRNPQVAALEVQLEQARKEIISPDDNRAERLQQIEQYIAQADQQLGLQRPSIQPSGDGRVQQLYSELEDVDTRLNRVEQRLENQ